MAKISKQPGTRSSCRTAALVTAILVVAIAGVPAQAGPSSAQRHMGWRTQEADTLRVVAQIIVTRVAFDLRDSRGQQHAFGETRLASAASDTARACEHVGHLPLDEFVTLQPLRDALLNLPPPVTVLNRSVL